MVFFSVLRYNILRRLLPLANLLMAHFVLKKTPSVKIMVSVLLVVTGCLVAGKWLSILETFQSSFSVPYAFSHIEVKRSLNQGRPLFHISTPFL